jgi:ligand-binding sensor domain-containing protein
MKKLLFLVCAVGWITAKSQTYVWENLQQFPYSSVDTFLSEIVIDSKDNLWVRGEQGLFKITKSGGLKIYNSSNSPYENLGPGLCVDANDHIWIGNGAELLELDGDSVWKEYNSSNSGHPGQKILHIQADKNGNIWCVLDRNGIGKFNNGTFTLFNTSNSQIPTNFVTRVTIDRNNNVWLISYKALIKFNQVSFTTYLKLSNGQDLPSDMISIHADKNSHIWAGCFSNKIVHFDVNQNTVKTESPVNTPGLLGVNKIIEDKIGKVWFIASSGEVFNFNGTQWSTNVGNSSAQNGWFIGGGFDRDNTLWVTSNNKGLFKLTNTNPDTGTITRIKETTDISIKAFADVFPNPTVNGAKVKYGNFKTEVAIKIFDNKGVIIRSHKHLAAQGEVPIEMGLQQGIYFVHISSQYHSITKKLIIL